MNSTQPQVSPDPGMFAITYCHGVSSFGQGMSLTEVHNADCCAAFAVARKAWLAQFLREAARYLGRHGWCQSDTYEGIAIPDQMWPSEVDNPFEVWPPADATGAIGIAVYGYAHANPHDPAHQRWSVFEQTYDVLWDYLYEHDPFYRDVPDADLSEWNDQPDQTAEAVINALNGAADGWENAADGAA